MALLKYNNRQLTTQFKLNYYFAFVLWYGYMKLESGLNQSCFWFLTNLVFVTGQFMAKRIHAERMGFAIGKEN